MIAILIIFIIAIGVAVFAVNNKANEKSKEINGSDNKSNEVIEITDNLFIEQTNDIYYNNKQGDYMGGRCFLDHDAIPANGDLNPQENIIWENKLPDGEYDVKVKLYSKQSNLSRIPFSVTAFAGKYVEPAVFYFDNPIEKQVIHIATIKFKNGKVVTPIKFK